MKCARMALIAMMLTPAAASGQATGFPAVSFTTIGSPGDWTLDFTVTNFIGGTNAVYFFAVGLDGTVSGAPAAWSEDGPFGVVRGTGVTLYNDSWIAAGPGDRIAPGASLGGFSVRTSSAVPASIPWLAYALGGTYAGDDPIGSPTNPGFQGFVTAAGSWVVPEPSSLAGLALGALACLGYMWRRRAAMAAA